MSNVSFIGVNIDSDSVTVNRAIPGSVATRLRLATAHCGLAGRGSSLPSGRLDVFDGIWALFEHAACASGGALPEVLRRLGLPLKADGVLYASFKYGAGEREHSGRRFTDLDEEGLAALVEAVPALAVIETWVTGDRREGREGEQWLNAMVGRGSATLAGHRMSGQPHESSGPAE